MGAATSATITSQAPKRSSHSKQGVNASERNEQSNRDITNKGYAPPGPGQMGRVDWTVLGIALKSITCTARPKNHSASADLGTSIGSMPRPWPVILERAQHNYEPDTMPARSFPTVGWPHSSNPSSQTIPPHWPSHPQLSPSQSLPTHVGPSLFALQLFLTPRGCLAAPPYMGA